MHELLEWLDSYPIHPGNRIAIKEKIQEIVDRRKNKSLFRKIKSMMTMQKEHYLYFDTFDKKEVWLYRDCYNNLFWANKDYIPFWSCRIKG